MKDMIVPPTVGQQKGTLVLLGSAFMFLLYSWVFSSYYYFRMSDPEALSALFLFVYILFFMKRAKARGLAKAACILPCITATAEFFQSAKMLIIQPTFFRFSEFLLDSVMLAFFLVITFFVCGNRVGRLPASILLCLFILTRLSNIGAILVPLFPSGSLSDTVGEIGFKSVFFGRGIAASAALNVGTVLLGWGIFRFERVCRLYAVENGVVIEKIHNAI